MICLINEEWWNYQVSSMIVYCLNVGKRRTGLKHISRATPFIIHSIIVWTWQNFLFDLCLKSITFSKKVFIHTLTLLCNPIESPYHDCFVDLWFLCFFSIYSSFLKNIWTAFRGFCLFLNFRPWNMLPFEIVNIIWTYPRILRRKVLYFM